jgi:hypothetical protein
MVPSDTFTRRSLLALSLAAPAFGLSESEFLWPDIGDRLKSLWRRAFGVGARSSSDALLVSRPQFEALPPLRGWRDERFLNAYIEWSDRPEGIGLHWLDPDPGGQGFELTADVGPHDLILIRSTGIYAAEPKSLKNPIGQALFDPGPGVHHITGRQGVGSGTLTLILSRLSLGALPTPAAVIAVASDIVTIYGTGFEGSKFEIASERGEGTILYSSPTQVNARVPSLDRIRLTVDGSSSAWVPVRKQ